MKDQPENFSQRKISNKADSSELNLLDLQIKRHLSFDKSQSQLAKTVSWASRFIWSGNKDSVETLKCLRREIEKCKKTGDAGLTEDLKLKVKTAVNADSNELAWRNEISRYGTGFLKTASLFLPGGAGKLATIASYGLDQARANDSLSTQLLDGGLGALKGGALRWIYATLWARSLGIASKGVLTGMSSRALDLALDRQTYLTGDRCRISLGTGLSRVTNTMLDPAALIADAAVFAVAHGLSAGANKLTAGFIEKSPLLSTMVSGGSFGMTNGAFGEIQRQRLTGEELNIWKVAGRSLVQGGIDTIAAAPGGVASDAIFRTQARESLSERLSSIRLKLGKSLDLLSRIADRLSPTPQLALGFAGAEPAITGEPEMLLSTRRQSKDSGGQSGSHAGIDQKRSSQDIRAAHSHLNLTETTRRWPALPENEKLSSLAQLQQAPESERRALWRKAIADSSQKVRLAAADGLPLLPSTQKLSAWRDAVHASDYFVRLLALAQIGVLPPTLRNAAWSHAFESGSVLAPPAREASYPKKSKQDGPQIPDHVSEDLRQILSDTPAEHLVKAIATLPARRLDAWKQCLNDERTHRASVHNINVLPPPERVTAWTMLWNRYNYGVPRAGAINETADRLVAQIPHLSPEDRATAWNHIVEGKARVSASSLAQALSSLSDSEHSRSEQWRRLLRTSPALSETAPEALEGLPESQRFTAWQEARTALGDFGKHGLSRAIRSLPHPQRLPAFKQMLETFPSESLAHALHHLRAADILPFVDAIEAHPDQQLRQALLKNVSLYDLKNVTVAERIEILTAAFERAGRGAAGDVDALRQWWNTLPEGGKETGGNNPGPIRIDLAGKLNPDLLQRMIFGSDPSAQEVGKRLSLECPKIVRLIARESVAVGDGSELKSLVPPLSQWLASRDLAGTYQTALTSYKAPAYSHERSALPQVLHGLAHEVDSAQKARALEMLKNTVLDDTGATRESSRLLALMTASQFARTDPDSFMKFRQQVEHALCDTNRSYPWRLAVARSIGTLERNEQIERGNFVLPDMRMPRTAHLSEGHQARLRLQVEEALRDNRAVVRLLSNGELGKLFPAIFGEHCQDGIVGRPQHGAHEFTLDVHTLNVLRHLRQHPEFDSLSGKDQVNLLWSALLHDTGKLAGRQDPYHEWTSGNFSWGVLRTLGYPPQRIQRIADLVTGHRPLSFDPIQRTSARLEDQSFRDELAMHYRHPSALKMLRILNESDIRAVNSRSSWWTSAVRSELDAITSLLKQQSEKLSQYSVPLLTSDLPQKFGLYPLMHDYSLLVHVSPFLQSTFLRQLGLIESPQYSISASLVTPKHKHFYSHNQNLLAIVSGPFEHISQAYRSNLGTGQAVDWRGHVELATRWLDSAQARKFAGEIDSRLRALGFGSREMLLPETI